MIGQNRVDSLFVGLSISLVVLACLIRSSYQEGAVRQLNGHAVVRLTDVDNSPDWLQSNRLEHVRRRRSPALDVVEQNSILTAHNEYRGQVGASNMQALVSLAYRHGQCK